ncbi:MAG: outer membrane beta-barrel protein [Bacteroidales bacterium]|nr:outer membrane beta-barrel protein [Bacteroidales bacterium]MBR4817104.1 outer membrane beta-barrel protein [Bacteroidales bacterium]MBR5054028.1 outer membrane beta-barrel protein [Bacteroidales bacterium]
MQNDKYTDFDLELKRMLHDAEEEVPSRIWDAVSGELDRRDRRKVVAIRWRRAAVGFAAAAAVLSGIFVFLGRDRAAEPALTAEAVQEQPVSADVTVEEAVPTIEEQIVSAGTALADVPAHVTRNTASSTIPSEIAPANDFVPTEEEIAEIDIETPSETAAETEAAIVAEKEEAVLPESNEPVQDPVVRPADTDTRTAITGTALDPFAWPEDTEVEKDSHLPSFFIAGNAMTNDFTGKDIRQMRAPASGIVKRTGVEDKGSSTFSIPVTVGLGVRFDLSDRWAVGTGINWSMLSRTFNGVYNGPNGKGDTVNINTEIVNDIHYVGIPLNLYFNIFDSRNLRFYAWGGGSAEKGLVSRFRIQSDAGDIFYKESVDGLQWSAAAGLGLEFLLGRHLGLYLDPSARYYFDCGQPTSIRTNRPFMMNYEVGLRFNL